MVFLSPLPPWFKQPVPDATRIRRMRSSLEKYTLNTVCQSAQCPNIGRCWGRGVATFMILGNTCTRGCRFCAVSVGVPRAVDRDEPVRVADAVHDLALDYVVITSVTRDDLLDGGAEHFALTIEEIHRRSPGTAVEALIPDFLAKRESIARVIAARPQVISHNMETVERLSETLRPQASYRRSLEVIGMVKELDTSMVTKSGCMVGLGEADADIDLLMRDLRRVECDMLTIGQYLAPSRHARHVPVERFVLPDEFEAYRARARALGFRYVASSPLVRSSYLAEDGYRACAHGLTPALR